MKLMIKIILLLTIITFSFALVEHLDVGEKKCFTNYNKIIVNSSRNCEIYIDKNEFCIKHIGENGLCSYFVEKETISKDKSLPIDLTRFEELTEEVKIINVLRDIFYEGLEKNCIWSRIKRFTDLQRFIFHSSEHKILEEYIDLYLTEYPEVINCQNEGGKTALMFASGNTNNKISENMVELLLKHNADINLQDLNGWTALMQASRNTRDTSTEKTLEILLKHNAKVNLQNEDGFTALMLASLYSGIESSEETVEILLKYGSDVNLQSYDGSTALFYAAKYSEVTSTDKTVKLLLDYGSNTFIHDKNGFHNSHTLRSYLDKPQVILNRNININLLLRYNVSFFNKMYINAKEAFKFTQYRFSEKTVELIRNY